MPYKNSRSVTLPKDVVDDVEAILQNHKQELRRQGIKKISHMFERAWFLYKEQRLPEILPELEATNEEEAEKVE